MPCQEFFANKKVHFNHGLLYIFPVPLLLFELAFQVCVVVVLRRLDQRIVREQVPDDDIQHSNQLRCHIRRPDLLTLIYFEAGLVAGAAAFSSLAGVLFAGFFASAFAGAAGATTGLGVVLTATGSPLPLSCANAVTANSAATIAIADFILKFPL